MNVESAKAFPYLWDGLGAFLRKKIVD